MISLTERGLYCEAGGFYIDPTKRVDVALITHAHSDHARRGSKNYFCVDQSTGLLKHRLGATANISSYAYRKKVKFGSTWISFHPAGHILGSAQIRIEQGSKVCVVSGDYKRDDDPTCQPFEVIQCDTFITEATFGNPKYKWGDQTNVSNEIYNWWQENKRQGINSLLFAYALGKTQRILAGLVEHTSEPVYLFGEASRLTECYRSEGVKMVSTIALESLDTNESVNGALIIAPQSISNTAWMRKLDYPPTAFASGWMKTGAFGMHQRYDRGFVMSDHADWPGLVQTILETRAKEVFVLHGGEGALTKHLRSRGVDAKCFGSESKAASKSLQGELFSFS